MSSKSSSLKSSAVGPSAEISISSVSSIISRWTKISIIIIVVIISVIFISFVIFVNISLLVIIGSIVSINSPHSFDVSTFDEETGVYTYRGGWVNIDASTKKLIKSVVIKEGVTEIATGRDANGEAVAGLFSYCTALTSITFPKTGTFVRIGINALHGCTSLATLAVPDSCVNIEEGALEGCSSLTSFTFPKKCKKLNMYVLSNCSSLTTLYIPDDCVEIKYFAIGHSSSLISLAIPNACTKIHWDAFWGCTALRKLADKSNITIEEYCRNKWRLPAFKINLFASYNVLNHLRVNDPLLNDSRIDKRSILWVMYDKITSDDLRRKIMEYLDYRWMGKRLT